MTKIEELSLKDATERHAQLVEIINQYRYEYHVNDNSIMSDPAAVDAPARSSRPASHAPPAIPMRRQPARAGPPAQ